MLEGARFSARRFFLGAADSIVTMPLLRWTWTGLADAAFAGELPELRPSDREVVRDMMVGRYLLASKLVETGGASPFDVEVDHAEWFQNLHGFSWLRHFRELRDPGERQFARMLVLDWIGHEGRFEHESWTLILCAQRVLNWLRHLPLLLDGATQEQSRTIQRSLGMQIQSLRVRERLARDPVDRLFAAMALVGGELCDQDDRTDIDRRLVRLNTLLAEQIDREGLHVSRNPKLQLQLLVDLASIRRAVSGLKTEASSELAAQVARMHESLDALTLGSGEPAYFNGCGQLPHDVLIAVQADGTGRKPKSQLLGGYGTLREGAAVVVADSGLVPPVDFAGEAHSSALAFEFSHGTELIVGSCGPAPASLPDAKALFRQGVAHSAPTIDAEDAEPVPVRGAFAGRLIEVGPPPHLELDTAENVLTLATAGYADRFGVDIERRMTLLPDGTTLVGQDRMVANGTETGEGVLSVRFHLAPGVLVERNRGDSVVRLALPKGGLWTFLWEGADFHDEESVRQSPHIGFHKTRQLVLETPVRPGAEISWVFTREQG